MAPGGRADLQAANGGHPPKGSAFLFDDLRQRVKVGKVAFNFNLELAQAGDKIDSATVPLPEGAKQQ